MSEPARKIKAGKEKVKKMLQKTPDLKIITDSFDQVRNQFAKLGFELPHHGFSTEVKDLTFKEKATQLWQDLVVKPGKAIYKSMMFRVLCAFFGTFVTAGLIVYSLEHDGNADQYKNWWDGIWWGIVTITTTGYGDKFPLTMWGRVVAAATMCIGIVTTGIVTGNIASWLVDLRLREARGLVNLAGKSGHLVICGWRREMEQIIEELFKVNKYLRPDDIVIIAPITQETLETFKSDERFARVNILRGDYYSQTMLEHASIRKAEKVIILSDWSKPNQTITEVDAKTVMTAMTIEKIAPAVYVAAELIDPMFESYLRIAHCDEIIRAKEYSRVLLANSTKNIGLAHVVYDLMRADSHTRVNTAAIPKEFIGKTFFEICQHFRKTEGSIVVGLLENSGNLHTMKKEALAEAQKNPDTRTVLRNLKEVRNLTTNLPLMNPPRNHIIKKYSKVVIIENEIVKAKKAKEGVA